MKLNDWEVENSRLTFVLVHFYWNPFIEFTSFDFHQQKHSLSL